MPEESSPYHTLWSPVRYLIPPFMKCCQLGGMLCDVYPDWPAGGNSSISVCEGSPKDPSSLSALVLSGALASGGR